MNHFPIFPRTSSRFQVQCFGWNTLSKSKHYLQCGSNLSSLVLLKLHPTIIKISMDFFRVQSQILTATDSWHHIRNFSYMTDMLSSSDKHNSSVWMVTSVTSVVNSWALNLDLLDRSATLGNPTHAPCEQSIPKKTHRISPVHTCGKSGKYMTGHMHTCAYIYTYIYTYSYVYIYIWLHMYEYVILYIYTYLSCFSDWWESWLCFLKCCWYTVIIISSTWLVSLVLSQYSTPKSPCLMFIVPFPSNAQLTTGW